MIVNGSAVVIEPVWRALRASFPPIYNNAIATSPSRIAQKALCFTGASVFPHAVILSIPKDIVIWPNN